MAAHGGSRDPTSDKRYYVTLVAILSTLIILGAIAANLIITLNGK